MGLIDKFKNLFTEEVEVEEPEKEKKEGVQKEVIQVEIPSPKKARSDRYEEISVEEKKEEIIEEPKKSEYKFPFFDDNDFDTIDVNRAFDWSIVLLLLIEALILIFESKTKGSQIQKYTKVLCFTTHLILLFVISLEV